MDISGEQYGNAFNAAPRPVRSFIVDGKLDAAVLKIANAHNLHVDVVGILQNAATNMLIGLENPAQVLGELVLAGVSGDEGKTILEELNQNVFVPVREKVQHFKETGEDLISPPDTEDEDTPSPNSAPAQKPVTEEAPVMHVAPVVPSAINVGPAQPPVVSPHTTVPPPPRTITPPPAPPLAPRAVPPVPRPAPPAPSSPPAPLGTSVTHEEETSVRTMSTDMQAVKEHRVPEPIPTRMPTPPMVTPQQSVPPEDAQIPSPPQTVAPPTQIPPRPFAPNTGFPETPEPMPPTQPRTAPPPPNLPGTSASPIVTGYSEDPYREPVE